MGASRSVVPNLVEMQDRRAFDVQQAVRRTSLGNSSAKSVLQVLAAAVDSKGWCFVSTENVIAESDVDLRTLQKIKQVFARMGLLKHVRLTRVEMATLRQRGGIGAFREEEWQLNLEMLGQDLSAKYTALLSQVNGKAERLVVVRGKAKPGPSSAAAADAADSPQRAAAAELCAAAAFPSDSLLGKNSIEHHGTPSHTERMAMGVDAKALSEAVILVCSTLGWRGPWAVREVYPACAEVLGALCVDLKVSISNASELLIAAWGLEQSSTDPAKSVPWWFGSGRWIGRVESARTMEASATRHAGKRRWTVEEYNSLQERIGRKPVSPEEYAQWPEHTWAWVDEIAASL